MADKELRSVRFPGLDDRYVVPEGGGGGAPGPAGKDGITPTIGENGNWYLGDIDTQKPSRGEKGADGAAGKDGSDGHTPVITAEKSGKVTTIKADGVTIATVNDGTDGTNGTDGAPGAKGDTGATGPQGPAGDDYVLTDADKTEIAAEIIAGGVEAELGDEPLPAPASAAVGQIVKVKAVDENGKITETEAVDMPSGGVGGTYRLVSDTTLAEATNLVTITQDISGNPFELTDCLVWIFAASTEESLIQVIPNSVWLVGTVVTFANKAKTDYSYDYLAYCHGDTDGFYGYAIIDRAAAAGANTFFNNARLMKATPQKLTSMKISCKFAAGARIMIYGR